VRALILAGLRDSIRRPAQTLLQMVGLALGVAVVVAIDLANASAQRGFEFSAQAVTGPATHRIVGGPAGLPEELYAELRVARGWRAAAPIVEGLAALPELDQRPVRVIGIDLFAERSLSPALPNGLVLEPGFARFFTDPDTVIVGTDFAKAHGLRPGDRLQVQTGDRLSEVEILGVTSGDSRLATTAVFLMDIAGAQELLGMVGRLSRIDLRLDEAEAKRLEAELPAGVRLETSSEQAEAARQLTAAFRTNLTALSLLALVVGSLLIYNSMRFSVLRRRAVFGTLGALGATASQIVGMVVIESLALAAAASALGVGLGLAMARAAIELVSQTITDFYFLAAVGQHPLSLGLAAKGAALGLGAGVLAALAPGIEAARTHPFDALRRSPGERRAARGAPALGLLGISTSGAGALVFRLSHESLAGSFVGLLLIVVGIALLSPLVVRGITRIARLARPGLTVRLATGNLGRHASRSDSAVSALQVALAVGVGITLMIGSFRSTVENWLGLTLRSDLYVSSPAVEGTRPLASLSVDLETRLESLPGVEGVETLRAVLVESEFGEVHLSAVDPRRVRDAGIYRFRSGTAEEVWEAVRGGGVLVSESLAGRGPLGDQIRLVADRGPTNFPIVGIFYDYSTDRGTVLMSREVYLKHWDDPSISSLGVNAAPGVEPAALAERVQIELAGTGLEVQLNTEVRKQALAIFDRTFTITAALRLLAVTVAFIGVAGALLAILLERGREYATLGALGFTGGGLSRLMLVESGMLGLIAALLAIPTGALLARLLIELVDARSFGWTIQMDWSPLPFLQALGVGLAASLLAAAYPAARLARSRLARALAEE
jgi:putative ABC transport system permease protein